VGGILNYFTGEYVYLNVSPIHGHGLFAKQKIIKNTIINNIVIQRGIWNHSTKPNCVVVGDESNFRLFDLKTIKDIEKGEEILVDYRNLNGENSKFKGMDLL
jgi:SET domain-containing protein